MTSCDDLVGAIRSRYASSGRAENTRILDEFAAVTGFRRKHAMQLLSMSAATLDRPLRAVKTAGRTNRHRGRSAQTIIDWCLRRMALRLEFFLRLDYRVGNF